MLSRLKWASCAAATATFILASNPAPAQQTTMQAAPSGAKPSASPPTITDEHIKKAAEGADKASDAASGLAIVGNAQEAAGAAIKANKSLHGPTRYSIGDKTINAGKKTGKIASGIGAAASAVDYGTKALNGDVGGIAENVIEEGMDSVAERLCMTGGPAAPACKAWYELNKMAGKQLDNYVKEKTGTGLRDRVTDGYYNAYEYAKSPEAEDNLRARMLEMSPKQYQVVKATNKRLEQSKAGKTNKGGDCDIFDDPARSGELADRDPEAWKALQARCF